MNISIYKNNEKEYKQFADINRAQARLQEFVSEVREWEQLVAHAVEVEDQATTIDAADEKR